MHNPPIRFIVFEAKVLKENVAAATRLLGEMVTGKVKDVAAAKAAMLCNLEAAKANPEEVPPPNMRGRCAACFARSPKPPPV